MLCCFSGQVIAQSPVYKGTGGTIRFDSDAPLEVISATSSALSKIGTYNVDVKGDLTIKGITKEVITRGTFTVDGNNLTGRSVFNIKISDYDIKIPAAVMQNIPETIEITVNAEMQKFESMARK